MKVPITGRDVEQREHHEVPVLRDERVHDQPRGFQKRGGDARVVRREPKVTLRRREPEVHRPVPEARRPRGIRRQPPVRVAEGRHRGGDPSVKVRADVLPQRVTRVRSRLLRRRRRARRELRRVPQQVQQRPQATARVEGVQYRGEREGQGEEQRGVAARVVVPAVQGVQRRADAFGGPNSRDARGWHEEPLHRLRYLRHAEQAPVEPVVRELALRERE